MTNNNGNPFKNNDINKEILFYTNFNICTLHVQTVNHTLSMVNKLNRILCYML